MTMDNDDDEPFVSTTPVGVTIARKHQRDGIRTTPPKRSHSSTTETSQRTINRSWRIFVEGATLYVTCLVLPTAVGILIRCYEDGWWKSQRADDVSWSEYAYDNAVYYLCDYGWSWCPSEKVLADARSSDLVYVAWMSLLLAVLRVAFVQRLVPLSNKENCRALWRVKSVHLLSSDYSETLTPTLTRRNTLEDLDVDLLKLPSLGIENNDGEDDLSMHSARQEPLRQPSDFAEQVSAKLSVHAAPRYATAIFRLLYSAVAVGLAWIYFSQADFWPWYVGGHGHTQRCWDLSGGLANVVDADFDDRNRVLKSYFLWQASYHWHSGAFHLLSMLWVGPPLEQTAYYRRLFQHLVSLAMIVVAYVFSSLRRLLAIGMFAFDISSFCLHLLQVCMNAPRESWLGQPRRILRLHKVVVVVFGVTRFGIWPALWWSACTESRSWLEQLDNTVVPGAARTMRWVMNLLFGLLMVITTVYGRRLVGHPHLGRIRSQLESEF